MYSFVASAKDHPRIRGEHILGRLWVPETLGSSPHTRGALLHPLERLDETRIIPAYAGSTYLPKEADIFEGDHPRIRGEHLPGDDRLGSGLGIIPAYAGSTPRPEPPQRL